METYEPEPGDVEEIGEPGSLLPARRGPGALLRPAASVDEIAEAMEQYQKLSERLLDESDYQTYQDRGQTRRFKKRSAWRKLAVAYGVSFERREYQEDRDDDGALIRAACLFRAIAPNGRFADGEGVCDRHERCCDKGCRRRHQHCPRAQGDDCDGLRHFTHGEHDIPATAATRAKNRAAADLFGLGEVSAEEIQGQGGGSPRTDPVEKEAKVDYPKSWKALWEEMARQTDGVVEPGDFQAWLAITVERVWEIKMAAYKDLGNRQRAAWERCIVALEALWEMVKARQGDFPGLGKAEAAEAWAKGWPELAETVQEEKEPGEAAEKEAEEKAEEKAEEPSS